MSIFIYSSLQRTATHCNALQHNSTHCTTLSRYTCQSITAVHCNTRCNALQHTLQRTAIHAATYCNTLQHNATHCTPFSRYIFRSITTAHWNTRCNPLQHTLRRTAKHTATHCTTLYNVIYVLHRAVPSYQKTAIFPKMREGIPTQFKWIRSWLVAPQGPARPSSRRAPELLCKIIRDKRVASDRVSRSPHCTGWRRPLGCLELQVIIRKRATNHRSLLRKMTYKGKVSCGSSPAHTV